MHFLITKEQVEEVAKTLVKLPYIEVQPILKLMVSLPIVKGKEEKKEEKRKENNQPKD